METERGQPTLKKAKKLIQKHVHTGTWYFASYNWYSFCCMFERTHSTAINHTAPQGKARHRTALCCCELCIAVG